MISSTPDKVVSIYLRTLGDVIENTPFCQAQELVERETTSDLYKVYVRLYQEFLIHYLAYDDEQVVLNPLQVNRTHSHRYYQWPYRIPQRTAEKLIITPTNSLLH